MKRFVLTAISVWLLVSVQAAITTYQFTSAAWASKVGQTTCNGTTDGWISHKDGAGYFAGSQYLNGLNNAGVQVTAGYSGAGAQSVIAFTNVRLTFNYCTNNKKGKGKIVVQVGDNDTLSLPILKPTDNGTLNREVDIDIPNQSGHIRFTIECAENSIYLNSLTIRAENASPLVEGLTRDVFCLVNNTADLIDGDEIIFGVTGNANYIMGLYDETVSRNNIHAIRGRYSADRYSVEEVAEAVYTLHKDADYYYFEDATGYYLVASGGNPTNGSNNRLTIWDNIESPNYGSYGCWTISIATNGAAEIASLGNSRSKRLQYNPNSGTPIFSCYEQDSQTPVALYKRETANDDGQPYIQAGWANFGTVVLDANGTATGSKDITINALHLTEDMTATLQTGTVFSINKPTLDRDGDRLTVSYNLSAAGEYIDTLVLTSGAITAYYPLIVNATALMNIAEVKEQNELTICYLDEVVITKKYDKYIFIQDETGYMMLFDGGNLYGKDRKAGDRLTGVVGRFKNYYGNPSLTLTEAFYATNGTPPEPSPMQDEITPQDACKYVRIENVNTADFVYYDLFNYGEVEQYEQANIEAIVYNYNGMVLCPIRIENSYVPPTTPTGIETPQTHKGILLYRIGNILIYKQK